MIWFSIWCRLVVHRRTTDSPATLISMCGATMRAVLASTGAASVLADPSHLPALLTCLWVLVWMAARVFALLAPTISLEMVIIWQRR